MLLETVGAAAGTIPSVVAAAGDNPTAAFTGIFPTWLADLTLLAIAIGAVAANAVNIYSGAISFNALGFKLPLHIRRAIVALGFGAIGFFVAWSGLHDAGTKYNNFLLIIAYWIAPWLAVMFCDMYPAPPPVHGRDRAPALQQEVHQLGRPGRDGGRRRRLDLAVRQPDEVRRPRSRPTGQARAT